MYESHFCTPGAGNEKGGVEHGVGYVRRNYMTPLLKVNSYQELNERLLESCLEDDKRQVEGQATIIKKAWEEERPHLLPLPRDEIDYSRSLSVVLTPYQGCSVLKNLAN